jgi:hypothetical protein
VINTHKVEIAVGKLPAWNVAEFMVVKPSGVDVVGLTSLMGAQLQTTGPVNPRRSFRRKMLTRNRKTDSLIEMHILIPKPGALQREEIKAGSGIVAVERADRSADIYYEGNLYGAENLRSYWGRLLCAAGRLAQEYPTVARLVDDNWNENFEHIGTFDYDGVSKAFESNATR